jgi:predicted SAM-dependent methyltransferase
VSKLHLGCQIWYLADRGWIDADIDPQDEHVMRMDATKEFPFADEMFDYIYSGHLLEHVSYRCGLSMLRECYRTLKPGGVLRITTPDTDTLMRWLEAPTETDNEYFQYQHEQDPIGVAEPDGCHVFNNFVRAWGHTFIYDRVTLRHLFTQAGFRDLENLAVRYSQHEELKNLEPVGRMPAGYYQLESQTVEGTK